MTRNTEEVREIVERLGYTYINGYQGNGNQRKVVIQDKHGYKYDVFLDNVLRGQGTGFVDKGNPYSLENIALWLKLNGSQFTLLENNEYKGSDSKLNLYCNKCKDYPKTSWKHISIGQGCGVCDGKQVGKYHNVAIQRPDIAKEWHLVLNGNLTPYDFTFGSNEKVWWSCPKGHEYRSTINDRRKGSGCPTCANKRKESNIANEMKVYVLGKYDSKEEYKIFRNPETNQFLPYDIYIFGGKDKNINGIYIEIHGEHHYILHDWHNRQSKKNGTSPLEEFEYQKHKDGLKRRFARKHGAYIEIDLRKIKTTEKAIEYIENILEQTLS